MKTINDIKNGANYAAINLGSLSELGEYATTLAPGVEIPAKVFIAEALKSTGAEISFTTVAPHAGGDFIHTHNANEELYIVLSGKGEFQVDGTTFPIAEGSVVRVSPAGRRVYRNTGDTPMLMLCIQSADGSLKSHVVSDGNILQDKVEW